MKIALADTDILLIYIPAAINYRVSLDFGREGIFCKAKASHDMPAMKLMLLAFVGIYLCYYVEAYFQHLAHHTPEDQVKIIKRLLKFHDEQIVDNWWVTENLTCKEVRSVWQMFNQSIASDLSLLVKDAEKHLKQVPPPRNRKMRRCIEDIKETVEEAVHEGVDSFKMCTGTSLKIQERKTTELEKFRDKYKRSINYTLENLERCLEHGNKNSEVHRKRCIQQTVGESATQIKAAYYNYFLESQCMAHFENDILECTAEAIKNTIAKTSQLKKDIHQCVGYSYFNTNQHNFGSTIKNMLSYYIDEYKSQNKDYYSKINEYSMDFTQFRIEEEDDSDQFHHNNLRNYLKSYYDSLRKTREENRSKQDRKCYSEAIEKLNNLIEEGVKDYTECENSFIQQRVEVVNTLTNIVKEFNTKLREGGNVALLRCFAQRPQDIFNSEAIRQCAELARESFNWELSKVQTKFKIMDNSFQPILILPNNKTCGWLRERKLIMDANKILNECARCIYGGSGDFYAVTTPPTYTEAVEDETTETTETAEQETSSHYNNHMEGRSPD